MAITKRMRVSFDLKCVYSTEEIDALKRDLVQLSKEFMTGGKLAGLHLELARIAAEYGPEAALELALKKSIKDVLTEGFREELSSADSIANFRFEVKR